jgi:hypothetical protein
MEGGGCDTGWGEGAVAVIMRCERQPKTMVGERGEGGDIAQSHARCTQYEEEDTCILYGSHMRRRIRTRRKAMRGAPNMRRRIHAYYMAVI